VLRESDRCVSPTPGQRTSQDLPTRVTDYRFESSQTNILKHVVFGRNFALFAWLTFSYTRVIRTLLKRKVQVVVVVPKIIHVGAGTPTEIGDQKKSGQNIMSQNENSSRKKNWRVSIQLIAISISYFFLVFSWLACEIFGRTRPLV